MEIRLKVEEYVYERIKALRAQHPGQYQNVSIMRMNAMKFLPNFFEKGQVINEQIKSQAKLYVIYMHSLNTSHPFPWSAEQDVFPISWPTFQGEKAQGSYY